MSGQIRAGDLVQVVRWPCCGWKLGYIGTVSGFVDSYTAACNNCGVKGPITIYATLSPRGDAPVEWLKRIPPIGELDDVKRDEEITA